MFKGGALGVLEVLGPFGGLEAWGWGGGEGTWIGAVGGCWGVLGCVGGCWGVCWGVLGVGADSYTSSSCLAARLHSSPSRIGLYPPCRYPSMPLHPASEFVPSAASLKVSVRAPSGRTGGLVVALVVVDAGAGAGGGVPRSFETVASVQSGRLPTEPFPTLCILIQARPFLSKQPFGR